MVEDEGRVAEVEVFLGRGMMKDFSSRPVGMGTEAAANQYMGTRARNPIAASNEVAVSLCACAHVLFWSRLLHRRRCGLKRGRTHAQVGYLLPR